MVGADHSLLTHIVILIWHHWVLCTPVITVITVGPNGRLRPLTCMVQCTDELTPQISTPCLPVTHGMQLLVLMVGADYYLHVVSLTCMVLP